VCEEKEKNCRSSKREYEKGLKGAWVGSEKRSGRMSVKAAVKC
jgi:hypothetical protein